MDITMTARKPQNVLVTGGGGFLGKAICGKLAARGDNVHSLCRRFYPQLEDLKVKQIQGDICDAETVDKAVKGMDAVFHTAARAGVWGAYENYYRVNVTGTRHVISACLRHKVPRLVHTSSPSVVFDGTDMEGINESMPYPARFHAAYPQTKAIAEQEVVAAAREGLKIIALRPHLIWGPGDNHLAPRIIARARKLVKIGRGDNRVDTIYIDNAADAHILAADALMMRPELSGRVYFISQDDPIVLWDMVDAILNAAGLAPVKRTLSHKTAWLAGALLECIYKLLKRPDEPPMTRFLADELATAHWFDISAAKKELGYFPAISTREGLLRLRDWLREISSETDRKTPLAD